MPEGIMTQKDLNILSKKGDRAAKRLDRLVNEPELVRWGKRGGLAIAGGLITLGIFYGLSKLS